MLQVMALCILRTVAENIGEQKFAIMVDETTDSSCTEQCVIVIRWIDSELCVHEEFLFFYAISTANADTIVSIILTADELEIAIMPRTVLRWGGNHDG